MQTQTVSKEKLLKTLSHEKAACKMLAKLTTGVKFANILWAAFEMKTLEVF